MERRRKQTIWFAFEKGWKSSPAQPPFHSFHPLRPQWAGYVWYVIHEFASLLSLLDLLPSISALAAEYKDEQPNEWASWEIAGVPRPIVHALDYLWRLLHYAEGAITKRLEKWLTDPKTVKQKQIFAYRIAQRLGCDIDEAFDHLGEALGPMLLDGDFSSLWSLANGDELCTEIVKDWEKTLAGVLALDFAINMLIDKLLRLIYRYFGPNRVKSSAALRILRERVLTRIKSWEGSGEREKPPERRIAFRFVTPAILSPSAPPCA